MPRLVRLVACVTLAMSPLALPVAAQTVTDSSLLDQREGYARATTGGINGQLYVVTTKADYAPGQTPQPGSLRYGVETLTGRRWIVFDPSLFTSTLSDGRKAARISLQRPLVITRGNITVDGRAGSVNGAGRVVLLSRTYDWNDYEVIDNGATCRVKTDAQGSPVQPWGGMFTIIGARNVILSHMIFRQYRIGTPTQPVADEGCFGDQIGIFNLYPDDDPHALAATDSFGKIWINRVQFYDCGDECVGITQPSPSLIALISITRSEFYGTRKPILMGNVGDRLYTKAVDGTNWRIRLTLAKNHFYNCERRMPQMNSTYLHAYNNFFQNWTQKAIDSREDTRVFVEQNFFSTYLTSGAVEETSIDTVADYNEQIWVDRNVYYKDADDRDGDYPPIPRYPEKGYYDSAAAPDILDIYSMNPVTAYTMLDQLGGWVAEANDLY